MDRANGSLAGSFTSMGGSARHAPPYPSNPLYYESSRRDGASSYSESVTSNGSASRYPDEGRSIYNYASREEDGYQSDSQMNHHHMQRSGHPHSASTSYSSLPYKPPPQPPILRGVAYDGYGSRPQSPMMSHHRNAGDPVMPLSPTARASPGFAGFRDKFASPDPNLVPPSPRVSYAPPMLEPRSASPFLLRQNEIPYQPYRHESYDSASGPGYRRPVDAHGSSVSHIRGRPLAAPHRQSTFISEGGYSIATSHNSYRPGYSSSNRSEGGSDYNPKPPVRRPSIEGGGEIYSNRSSEVTPGAAARAHHYRISPGLARSVMSEYSNEGLDARAQRMADPRLTRGDLGLARNLSYDPPTGAEYRLQPHKALPRQGTMESGVSGFSGDDRYAREQQHNDDAPVRTRGYNEEPYDEAGYVSDTGMARRTLRSKDASIYKAELDNSSTFRDRTDHSLMFRRNSGSADMDYYSSQAKPSAARPGTITTSSQHPPAPSSIKSPSVEAPPPLPGVHTTLPKSLSQNSKMIQMMIQKSTSATSSASASDASLAIGSTLGEPNQSTRVSETNVSPKKPETTPTSAISGEQQRLDNRVTPTRERPVAPQSATSDGPHKDITLATTPTDKDPKVLFKQLSSSAAANQASTLDAEIPFTPIKNYTNLSPGARASFFSQLANPSTQPNRSAAASVTAGPNGFNGQQQPPAMVSADSTDSLTVEIDALSSRVDLLKKGFGSAKESVEVLSHSLGDIAGKTSSIEDNSSAKAVAASMPNLAGSGSIGNSREVHQPSVKVDVRGLESSVSVLTRNLRHCLALSEDVNHMLAQAEKIGGMTMSKTAMVRGLSDTQVSSIKGLVTMLEQFEAEQKSALDALERAGVVIHDT